MNIEQFILNSLNVDIENDGDWWIKLYLIY